MQVNESRRDDETASVDRISASYRCSTDLGDSAITDSDILNRIEAGFRIHYPTAQNHPVVGHVGQVTTPACARNRKQTGVGNSRRCCVGVSRPLPLSRPNTVMEFDRWFA